MNKTKWKLNGVDIILAVVSATILLLLINIFFFDKILVNVEKKELVTLTLKFNDVSDNHSALIREKDSAFIDGDQSKTGLITSANIVDRRMSDVMTASMDETGDELDVAHDVVIQMQIEAITKDGLLIIDGVEYSVGNTINISTGKFGSSAEIINVTKSEELQ